MDVFDIRWICRCGAAHAVLPGVGYAAARHLLLLTVLLGHGTPLTCNPHIDACSHTPGTVLQLPGAQQCHLLTVPVPGVGQRQHKPQVPSAGRETKYVYVSHAAKQSRDIAAPAVVADSN
jgi:hypothetical protein